MSGLCFPGFHLQWRGLIKHTPVLPSRTGDWRSESIDDESIVSLIYHGIVTGC